MAKEKNMSKKKMKKEEKIEEPETIESKSEEKKAETTADDQEEHAGESEIEDTSREESSEESSEDKPDYESELNEMKDKYLRLSAEFDNFRKRTLKEKIELTKTAGKDILTDFLGIMDDFERAVENSETAEDVDSLKEGLILIHNKCKTFLSKNSVKEIEAKEKEFDVELHEAITKIPAPDKNLKGKVVDVIQKGYLIDEKVLRYSKVVVGE
jgi:molecular chaperone GrpE